ncbi:hypothetical protein [Leptothermofonsia sp. ETS-13]|uniref:hypothetical protein n=1 Tax=Leptothermofonsia sp. ETS-13 TaxID=3035696 RepID=UPI003B9F9101
MSAATKNLPSVLRTLWHPMLILAVGLHAIFLAIPLGSRQKQLPEVTEQPVQYNRLPDIKPTPPKSARKSTVKKQVAPPQKTVTSPRSLPLTTPNPSPATSYKPPTSAPSSDSDNSDSDNSVADSAGSPDNGFLVRVGPKPVTADSTPPPPSPGSVSAANSATTTTAVNSRPDLDPETRELIERLGDLNGRPIAQDEDLTGIIPTEKISNFFTNFEKKEPKPGLVGVEYLSTQKPEEVYEYLGLIYPDYTLKQAGEYGGGTIYEIKKGEYVRYFNLIRDKENKGTVIVLWKERPVY